jgi:hypothetical protein
LYANFFVQSVKLEGLVNQSQTGALEMANVMAVNKITNAMDAYATTDKGKYT